MTTLLRRSFRRNRKGIGTVFGMIFFILIVVIVLASFVTILEQNSNLEQTVAQNRQMDLDRANEQLEVIASSQPFAGTNILDLTCTLNNTGNLAVQLVRLWVEDLTISQTGNLKTSTVLNPGAILPNHVFSNIPVAGADAQTHQFRFWFTTARGNNISPPNPGTVIISQNVTTSLVSQGLGSISVDTASFLQNHPGSSSGGTDIGVSSTRLIIPLKLTILALNFTNYDPSKRTIYLSPDSYLWVPCMKNGGIQSVSWEIMNIVNNKISLATAPVPLPYGVPTQVYFGWDYWVPGVIVNTADTDYALSGKIVGLNAVLYGKIDTANGQVDFGQILPFKALKFLTVTGFPTITVTNPASASGQVGTTVTLSGSGFAPSSGLTATVGGIPVTIGGTTATNSGGGFSGATITIPSVPTGVQTITFLDASGNPADAQFTVTSAPLVSITIDSSPAGSGYITVDGVPVTTPQTYSWAVGGLHTIAVQSLVSGGLDTQYVFTGWSDSGAQSHSITVPASSTTYTASYKTQYQVSFVVSPSGSGTTTPASNAWCDQGLNPILAMANSGYKFSSWSYSGSVSIPNPLTANPATATVTGPGTITANFVTAPTLALDPNPGSHSSASFPNVRTGTITVSTSNSNDIIYVVLYTFKAGLTYNMPSSANLPAGAWTQRGTISAGGNNGEMHCWYAVASSPLTNEVITVSTTANWGDNAHGANALVFSVSGANTASPFDSGLPATLVNGNGAATGNSGTSSVTITTNNANDLIVGVVGLKAANAISFGGGFTVINAPMGNGISTADAYLVVSSAGSKTITSTFTSTNWVTIADAFVP